MGVSYLYGIRSSGTTFTAYCCFPGMSLQRAFVLRVFVCSVNLSLFSGYHAEGYHARTDTFKPTENHVCRVTTPSYHAPYKRLLGTGGLSHLRVVFSYFSFHRLNTSVLPQHQPQLSTEPGAHRTDAHNTLFPTEPGAHRTDPLNTNNDFQPSRIKSRQDRCFGQQFSAHLCSCDGAGAVVL